MGRCSRGERAPGPSPALPPPAPPWPTPSRVGNIGGVATAVISGGPGALFWMWVSSLLGMSTKACEIILGQRFRVKYSESMDEYMCDRSFVMKNALGWKKGAVVLSVACFTPGALDLLRPDGVRHRRPGAELRHRSPDLRPWCWASPASSPSPAASSGSPPSWTRVVPFMAVCYILGGLGILIVNWSAVPEAFALIFKSAFTPMAGWAASPAPPPGTPSATASPGACTPTTPEPATASSPTPPPGRTTRSDSPPGAGARCSTTLIVCTVTGLSHRPHQRVHRLPGGGQLRPDHRGL